MNVALRVLALVLAAAWGAAVAATPAPAPLPADSVYQLPLQLTGQDGRTWPWARLRGTPRVVAMFYASCQYMCPLIIDGARGVERGLTPAQQQRVGFVLLSMDPRRDTPAALQALAAKRRLAAPRWLLAAPAQADVRKLAGVLGIRYRALADGEFNHTSELILLDADGRIIARTEQVGARVDPAFLAAVRRAATPAPNRGTR